MKISRPTTHMLNSREVHSTLKEKLHIILNQIQSLLAIKKQQLTFAHIGFNWVSF